jgi:alpha-glucuronidase
VKPKRKPKKSFAIDQIENPDNIDLNHWRCLNDSVERTYSGTSCRMENVKPFACSWLASRIIGPNVFR